MASTVPPSSTPRPASGPVADLRQLMLDASPDCIKVLSPDGRLIAMNRAGCHALGVDETGDFGMPWLPLLPADVHAVGRAALDRAVAGHPARFPGRSEGANGALYWDNLLTPLAEADGRVDSVLCVSREVTAATRLRQELEDAVQRERLRTGEMHHRLRNLFSLVSSLIHVAERQAGEPGGDALPDILRAKLAALSRASDAAVAPLSEKTDARSDLAALVASVLAPYHERCSLSGGVCEISASGSTTVALLLHELATNAVKYGALSLPDGHVAVRWFRSETPDTLVLSWTETGGPPPDSTPSRQGFGSRMVDRMVLSAGGHISRHWQARGLAVELHLPAATIAT